jgi:hypothetical protein
MLIEREREREREMSFLSGTADFDCKRLMIINCSESISSTPFTSRKIVNVQA